MLLRSGGGGGSSRAGLADLLKGLATLLTSGVVVGERLLAPGEGSLDVAFPLVGVGLGLGGGRDRFGDGVLATDVEDEDETVLLVTPGRGDSGRAENLLGKGEVGVVRRQAQLGTERFGVETEGAPLNPKGLGSSFVEALGGGRWSGREFGPLG